MFNRNFRSPRTPRVFNSRFRFPLTPLRGGVKRRPYGATRKLNYERVERPLSVNVLVERQHGPHMALSNNHDSTSFVGFPVRGINGDGRSKEYIKLMQLNVSGVLNVKAAQGDQPMEGNDKLSGLFVITILLDRKPFLPEGVNQLPSYAELFGPYSSAYVNQHVLDVHKQRFRILGCIKKYVTCSGGAYYAPFKLNVKLSHNRFPLWAAFKDVDPGNCGGNYKNIAKNAILVSYAFVGMDSLKVEPFVQFELKYLG
uniref:Nuclear shuttle protein n=1 Tax=Rhynchosia yellow mosaic virus TaxID=529680 RepID=C7TPG1_9GEMI|nr:nuclear shuttle protein [Rhynchosia yellow mosaic virus]